MSNAGLLLLPVYNAESVQSARHAMGPIWLPGVNQTIPRPLDNAVKRLRTSARPKYNGLTVNGSASVGGELPATDDRMLFTDGATSPKTSRDEMTSPETARDDDERTLIEKTLPQLKAPSQSSGNH